MSSKVLAAVFLIILLAVITLQGQSINFPDYNLAITSNIEDYIAQNKRQYADDVRTCERTLSEFKRNYLDRIETVSVQSNLVETKLNEAENQLNPLEAINDSSKHCVQKYRGNIASAYAVEQAVSLCTQKGTNLLPLIIAESELTLKKLRQHHDVILPQLLDSCRKQNTTSNLNYTLCITKNINDVNIATSNYTKTFVNHMKKTSCSGDYYVKETVDCSFNTVYETVAAIGETMRLINNCIQGKETCPVCEQIKSEELEVFSNCLQYNITAIDNRNATIANPFFGLSRNIRCLQINLL